MTLKGIRFGLVNWALCIAGLVALTGGLLQLFKGEATLSAAGLGAGLVLLIAATIERFESVKGLGMEAKTLKLDEKISEADIALQQLKRLTEIAGASLINLASRTGRWAGPPPPREAYALSRTINDLLKSVGSTPDSVRAALVPWARTAIVDITMSILGPLYDALQKGVGSTTEGEVARAYGMDVLKSTESWRAEEFSSRLRAIAAEAPAFVPAEALSALKSDLQQWLPEIDSLAKNLDFLDRESGLEQIEWQHANRPARDARPTR